MKKQKKNWWIDAILFVCFIVTNVIDWTGLFWHQWLGVFLGALAAYHLWVHWDWVKSATAGLFKRAPAKVRLYYALDGLLLAGFGVVLITGLAASTWFDLPLSNYDAWVNVHILASIALIVILALKLALHWRWIVGVAKKQVFAISRPAAQPLKPALAPVTASVSPAVSRAVSRREFLGLTGVVSVASLLAMSKAWEELRWEAPGTVAAAADTASQPAAQASTALSGEAGSAVEPSTPEAQPTAQSPATSTAQPTAAQAAPTSVAQPAAGQSAQTSAQGSVSCAARCHDHCSAPGRCRKFVDSNGNNLCDNGECA